MKLCGYNAPMFHARIHPVFIACTACVGVKVCVISTQTTTIKG